MDDRPTSRLSLAKLRELFAVICADQQVYRRASRLLAGRELGDAYDPYRFILEVMDELWEEFKQMPTLSQIRAKLSADLTEQSDDIDEDYVAECNEVYGTAKDVRKSDAKTLVKLVRVAHQSLTEFAEYLTRLELMDAVATGDLPRLLADTQHRLKIVQASDADLYANPFGEVMEQRVPGRYIPTGIAFVDEYTGGQGPVTGDVVGHGAPRGSGKSTLVSQVATEIAKRGRIEAENSGLPPRCVYVFNYEQVEDPLSQMISYLAKVPREDTDQFIFKNTTDHLSCGTEYKEYEKKRFARVIALAQRKKGPYPLAEAERVMAAREVLKQNVMVVDFSGSSPGLADMATGFVDGVLEYITNHQQQVGNPGVDAVFMDYASAAARAHMRRMARTTDSTERLLVDDLSIRLKHSVAGPFKAFCWVSQQLAAEQANKRGGSRPDPNKFKGCQSFAENQAFCFVNGVPTPSGLSIFVHSKVRRGSPQPDRIGQLNGKFAHWKTVTDGHAIQNGQIMDQSEARRFGGFAGILPPDS